MAQGGDVRRAAVALIFGVTEEGQPISDQITRGALAGLGPSERARAQRLALGVLRRVQPIDRLLKPFLRKAPPAYVHTMLRLACFELLAEGAAAHGVVNETVGLVRSAGRRTEGFAGMANAVLRKVSALSPELLTDAEAQALPGWLRGRMMSAWGKATTMAIEAAHAAQPFIDLTPKDGDAAALATRVGGQALPTGSVRLPAQVHLSELPGYSAGDWWVQDAAAALAARALRPRPGERLLDLCAAPGGKTLQLAAAGAAVTALDLSPARMARVSENLARCGLAAEQVIADALTWQPEGLFDAILLDAPCSATGTIRRHPDLPFVKDSNGLKDLVALQAAMFDRALGWLRPGGRLVYATCSLLPDEGERQLARALEQHGDRLSLDRAALELPGILPDWLDEKGGLRLRPDYWPDQGGMDGFFIAAFRLKG